MADHSSFWRNQHVLITGGAGFIGSNLAQRLLAEGAAHVRAVDNLERGRLAYLKPSLDHPSFEFQHGDLRDPAVARAACAGRTVVFHLASKVGGIGYYLSQAGVVFGDNVLIDHNVWSAAVAHGVPFYVYATSAHIYPAELQGSPDAPAITEAQAYPANPQLSYGWAKLVGEQHILFAHEQGCQTHAALPRLIGAYGPNQDLNLSTASAIPAFCRRAIEYPQRSPFIALGTGAETRSFHYITDTLDALLLAVEKLQHVSVLGPFNLGRAGRVTIREIAETIIAISGKSIEIEWDTRRPTAIWGQALDCSLATELLDGWVAQVSLREGLEHVYRHIEARLQAGEGGA
jgi:nucleoside-diphosphate-sugar epimerase